MGWVLQNGEYVWVEGDTGTGDPTGGAGTSPNIRMIDGIPWMLTQDPTTKQWYYTPVPTGYDYQPYQPPAVENSPFYHTPDWYVNQGRSVYPESQTYNPPMQYNQIPQFNYPSLMQGPGGGGGGGGSYMQYDPFSQQLQAAQLQESIRQTNLATGYNRSTLLNDVLSNPANVFASWFQARGQVPPYNAQLANILNIPNGGNPWFGALPPMGETPLPPTVPTPGPPQAIPAAAKGGTFIPPEPAVAIGLTSGQPLFTFNENAPQQTEKVKITPQLKKGGTVKTRTPKQGEGDDPFAKYGPFLSNLFNIMGSWGLIGPPKMPFGNDAPWQPQSWGGNPAVLPNYQVGSRQGQLLPNAPFDRGNASLPSFLNGGTALPAPIQDFYDRGGPQFPWMTDLGLGRGLQYPDMSQAAHGMPTPSLQSLNRMLPSEQQGLFSMYNTLFGISPEDVLASARYGFNNLRSATPALQRIQ